MSASDAGLPRKPAGGSGEPVESDVDTAISLLDRLAGRDDLSPADVRAIVSAATRLYANASAQAGRELPLAAGVSATDAVMLACALMRSQGLTPFDMAMWFGRGAGRE